MKCLYKNNEYLIEFLDYKKRVLTIKCQNEIKEIEINSFYGRGGITPMLKKLNCFVSWKYEIGDYRADKRGNAYIIVDKKIVSKQKKNYVSNEKHYMYKCLRCNIVGDWHREDANIGCPYCSGKKVQKGVNDMKTLFPQYVKYLKDKSWADSHTGKGNEVIDIICPRCQHNKQMIVSNLTKGHFYCDKCCDGFSYPEKFISNVLKQLNIEYIYQLSNKHFKWCDKYRYDFYLPKYHSIIEVNGMQHYKETKGIFSAPLEEQQKIDRYKKELAINNGIRNYYVVDTRFSDCNFIKTSLINTINEIDFNKINWQLCVKYASSSLLTDSCEDYNNGMSIAEISQKYHISENTIRRYLKQGNKVNLCSYIPQIGGYREKKRGTTIKKFI